MSTPDFAHVASAAPGFSVFAELVRLLARQAAAEWLSEGDRDLDNVESPPPEVAE